MVGQDILRSSGIVSLAGCKTTKGGSLPWKMAKAESGKQKL
jgi:hypothetical protein